MPPKKGGYVDPTAQDFVVEAEGTAQKGGWMPVDQARFMNINYSAEFMATLPAKIQQRVRGLLALDKKYQEKRADYDKKRRELIDKFEKEQAAPIYAQRKKLITGEEAPEEDLVQAGLPAEHREKEVDVAAPDNKKAEEEAAAASSSSPAAASFPDKLAGFWLRALKRHVIVDDMITERDEAVLKSCTDISISNLDKAGSRGFVVKFEFEDNDFFKNRVLTKTFHIKEIFDELTVERTEGTEIEWASPERNVTMRIVNKKQKAKVKGKVVHRTTQKKLRIDSFFHFFSSSTMPIDGDDDDDEGDNKKSSSSAAADIEDASDFGEMDDEQWLGLANVLKDKIIPYAGEYFTHEANDGESDLDDDDYDFDDDDDDDDDDEDDEDDYMPMRGRGGGGMGRQQSSGAGSGGRPGPGGKQPPAPGGKDCKQQ